jgi:hypothetical protein
MSVLGRDDRVWWVAGPESNKKGAFASAFETYKSGCGWNRMKNGQKN